MTQMSEYQKYIALSRYARWIPAENRRESWDETVDRYMENVVAGKVDQATFDELRTAIVTLNVMPSMRGLMTAGDAMDRDNTCAYNCS